MIPRKEAIRKIATNFKSDVDPAESSASNTRLEKEKMQE